MAKQKTGKEEKRKRPAWPSGVQEIRVGTERAVIVPMEVWERLMEDLEDYVDLCEYEQAGGLDRDEEVIEHDDLCRQLGRCPLKYTRLQAGLGLDELSSLSGFSRSHLEKIEAGDKKVTKSCACKLAKALGVEPEDLMA